MEKFLLGKFYKSDSSKGQEDAPSATLKMKQLSIGLSLALIPKEYGWKLQLALGKLALGEDQVWKKLGKFGPTIQDTRN
jgi:hypothetical protein